MTSRSIADPDSPLPLSLGPKWLTLFVYCILAVLLLSLRIGLWHVSTTDMDQYFLPWQDALISHGRASAFIHPIGNYFASYFEVMALTSQLDGHLSRIAQIKLFSFCFDLVAAGVAFLFVGILDQHRSAEHRPAAEITRSQIAAIFVILAGPTVILDGAAWGQSDIVYTTFLLLSVLFILRNKGAWASLAYGFAFAFKLQAIFFAPFFLVAILRRRIPVWSLALFPVGWLLELLPTALLGGSVRSFVMLPFQQTHELSALAINVANPWALANFVHFPLRAGVLLGLALSAIAGLWIVVYGLRKSPFSPDSIVALAATSLLVMPYVMPKMHDRYFFPAEILLSILACVDLEYLLPAALVIVASLLSYVGYFMEVSRHQLTAMGLVGTTVAVCLVLRKVMRSGSPDSLLKLAA